MTRPADDDRELWAVLVALGPLDARKWRYVDVNRRTFDAERCLAQPWSSGERALVEVAASLWDSGTVDLGYIACAVGGQHFQAVVDALAIRAGRSVTSNVRTAIRRVATPRLPAADRAAAPRRDTSRLGQATPQCLGRSARQPDR
jgi:hypothetical protein